MARSRPAQPHSEEAERAILGALLLEPESLAWVRTRLEPHDWYLSRHRRIYQAFLDIAGAGATLDLLTLQAHLQQAGALDEVGGISYLAVLDLDLPDLGRLDEYVDIVKDRSVRREFMAEAQRSILAVAATARPVNELLAVHHGSTEALLGRSARAAWERGGDVVGRLLSVLEDRRVDALCGLTSGFPGWDRLGPGFLPGGLYVVAGRPGMGKTSLALDLIRHVALDLHRPVGVFSLEMRNDELGLKLSSAEADIASGYLRTGHLSGRQWRDLIAAMRRVDAAPLFLDHCPAIGLSDLEARAWWLKANQPDLALLVVDYLQLLSAGVRVENRRLEIALIARRLKELAGELGLVVIALSQINREPTRRSDPRPQLADLSESDAIGQHADQVAFIHRPEVYSPEDESLRGLAEIVVAKHRHGATGLVELTWTGATASFRSPSAPAPADRKPA